MKRAVVLYSIYSDTTRVFLTFYQQFLQRYLSKDDNERTSGVGTMREELCCAIETRFHSITEDENYVMATVTDPRFKLQFAGPKGQDRSAFGKG